MKKIDELFVGWYDYPNEEYEKILKESKIAFDTNVLLNLYRYSTDTSNKTLNLFFTIEERIIVPYTVAKEFTTNRKKVEYDSIYQYDKMQNDINKKYAELLNDIDKISDKKLSDKEKAMKSIQQNQGKILDYIKKEKDKKEKLFQGGLESRICRLINGKILEDFSKEDYLEIKTEGIRRMNERIPPGYKDDEKEENGDYYIFKSIINYSKENKEDIIFVTDDLKEDWFQSNKGNKAARSELLEEFFQETQQKIIIIPLQTFIKNKSIFNNVSKDVVDEICITSIENQKKFKKINTKIKKYLRYVTKYSSIKEVINNEEDIFKYISIILRICEGYNDSESASEYKQLYKLLLSKRYDDYLVECIKYQEKIGFSCENDLENIKRIYNEYIHGDNSNYLELLECILEYCTKYLNNDYESKIISSKIRELIRNVNSSYMNEAKQYKEIQKIYYYMMKEIGVKC